MLNPADAIINIAMMKKILYNANQLNHMTMIVNMTICYSNI